MEAKLNAERRAKRKVWTAQGLDKYKIRSDEGKIKVQNARELEKSRKRPRRFVSPWWCVGLVQGADAG